MSKPTDELNDDQLRAIHDYKEQIGRDWKKKLSDDWLQAGGRTPYRGEWAYLQQVRNRLGPSWLKKVTEAEIDDAVTQRLPSTSFKM